MSFLKDGYRVLLSFGTSSITMTHELSVTPPGIEGGDKIPQTNFRNETWRTFWHQALKELTDGQMQVHYDVQAYGEYIDAINVNQQITATFPDGKTLIFWGYMKNFVPNELVAGEKPTAVVELIATNLDATEAETAPSGTAIS